MLHKRAPFINTSLKHFTKDQIDIIIQQYQQECYKNSRVSLKHRKHTDQ